MKINLITLHRAENYGSVLQTLALQNKFVKLGHNVTILDYYPERYTKKGLLKRLKDKSTKFKNPLLLLAAKILIYPSYIRKGIVFNRFLKNCFVLPFTLITKTIVKLRLIPYFISLLITKHKYA